MKGCLIALAWVILVGALLFGGIGYCTYTAYKNFPAYAKKEVVYKKYEEMLKSIDDCVANSDSALSLAANLEKVEMPDELIYFALEKTVKDDFGSDDEELIEITKKYEGDSISRMIINGSGYGSVNGNDIIIIKYDIDNFDDVESCIIYLKHIKKHNE